jgi:hypothetical protein
MIVMPSNNTGFEAGMLAGRFPRRIAHLHSVESPREPKEGIPWALDNGVFGAWNQQREWSEEPLYRYLDQYADRSPMWVVVPDWVGDRDETLRRWGKHVDAKQAFGVPMAMAVQDGMTPDDVPHEASVIFVGGTTSWKWRNLKSWTENFPRVHVGRVNTYRLLWMAHDAGAESTDGTGWFRGCKNQLAGLKCYLEESSGLGKPQAELELC